MINKQNQRQSTKKKIKIFLESLQKGVSISQACESADLNRTTLWLWRKKDKKLDEEILAILDSRTQVIEDALYKSAINGNITAQIFWLKNRAPKRWRDVQDQRQSGEIKLIIDKRMDI